MAICKTCGCAIPLGSKRCDMCATTASIAPAQSIPSWAPAPPAAVPSGPGPSAIAPTPSVQPSPAGSLASLPAATPQQLLKAQKAIRSAWQFIAFIGALSVVVGAVAELGNINFLLNYFDWYTAGEGLIFLVLAYFIRGGSLIALGIAIGLYALDTVALFLTGHFAVIRILILVYLVRALGSANLLRRQRQLMAQQSAPDQPRAA
jgi:hypothetical protein